MQQAAQLGQDYVFRKRIRRASDGAWRWHLTRAAPVRGPDGTIVRWLGTDTDIHDLTETEGKLADLNLRLEERVLEEVAARKEAQSQAAHAQRMQALGQLAGGIAHDLNNILQAVEGAATLAVRRPNDVASTMRLASTARDAARRGASITGRLLSFARKNEIRVDALAMPEVLNSVREVLSHTLGTAISVRSLAAADLPFLNADRSQLETVLVNLGTNARDAMPDGGTLTFSADAELVTADDPHGTGLAPGAYIRLSVADTGIGMDAATLAQATEAFFTTKPIGQGTGLGLPMVKSFAEQSGGAIRIDSTPGAGTSVTLWLPQAISEPVRPAIAPDEPKAASAGPSRIMVVDDDDMVREILAAQLEDLGLNIVVASSGAQALAILEKEKVDALVTDLSMPDMNGVTAIEKARILRPGLPCFLLTGYGGERAALGAGDAFTLVRKPISAERLVAQIEAGMRREQARVS